MATTLTGINESGQIAGIYRDVNGIDHGFIATHVVPDPAMRASEG